MRKFHTGVLTAVAVVTGISATQANAQLVFRGEVQGAIASSAQPAMMIRLLALAVP